MHGAGQQQSSAAGAASLAIGTDSMVMGAESAGIANSGDGVSTNDSWASAVRVKPAIAKQAKIAAARPKIFEYFAIVFCLL
jgi:hypothetical protein